MALRSLAVEGFRGLRAAQLAFDQTTVLFGENDCGKSSLLEALSLVLSPAGAAGPPVFQPWHFHRRGAAATVEPVRVQVTLRESRRGSWDRSDAAALAVILGTGGTSPRTLVLDVTAHPASGSAPVAAHYHIRGPCGATAPDDAAALRAVRRLNPLLWLRGGSLVGASLPEEDHPGEISADAAEVLRRFDRLLTGETDAPASEIEAGYAAAERLLSSWVPAARASGFGVRAAVTDVLGHDVVFGGGPTTGEGATARQTTPQKLGVFLLMAQLFQHFRGAAPGVRPTIVFEEPEAGLHPMTLASLWDLLERLALQKVVSTHSGSLLAASPLASLRRLVRSATGEVRVFSVRPGLLGRDDLRKVSYHLRARRGTACFARCWLLVEGETEFWLLPDLARLCGYDLAQEGVACVEFAQCGLPPLVKLAGALGIEWHALADGDRAGSTYGAAVRRMLRGEPASRRLTQLAAPDIEHTFWYGGYAPVFERLAGPGARGVPRRVIGKAIDRHSKPGVAFALLAATAAPGSPGPPPSLHAAIETCVALARRAPLTASSA